MAQQTTLDMAAAENTNEDADADTEKQDSSLEDAVESRTYKAVTEDMDLKETESDNAFEFTVFSASGSEYTVEVDPQNHRSQDSSRNTCECMDYNARNTVCKHQRAVALATGLEPMPQEADAEDVNNDILEVLTNYVVRDVFETSARAIKRAKELVF